MDRDTRKTGVDLIARYYSLAHARRGTYFLRFVTCELLNFANVLGQIYFTDMFLGYQFTKYGREVFAKSEDELALAGWSVAVVCSCAMAGCWVEVVSVAGCWVEVVLYLSAWSVSA